MTRPSRVAVATTSRADFGIYRSVLAALHARPELALSLIVSGMHLSPEFGETISEVERAAYPIRDRVEILVSSDTPGGVAKSMGLALIGMADAFSRERPDLLVVLGDRFEMHAVASAAVPFRVPLAHIHGGEETEGAIDNAFRHAISKMAQLHFTATEQSAARLRAMGEPASRVFVSGAPALDRLDDVTLLDRAALAEAFGTPDAPFLLVTYHPSTLDPAATEAELDALLEVLEARSEPVVLTLANADMQGRTVNARLQALADAAPARVRAIGHMGPQGYFSAMRAALAMIGNSSSGILEAASFGLPVLNIGDRQKGRERSENVLDVEGTRSAILAGLERALSPEVGRRAAAAPNIYHRGDAGQLIATEIVRFLEAGAPVAKRFAEVE